jgi:hypothetical protein
MLKSVDSVEEIRIMDRDDGGLNLRSVSIFNVASINHA